MTFPANWKRSTLLAYVRSQHPDESVRIVEWHDAYDGFEPIGFMPNPAAFSDFRRGKLT